MEQSRFRNCQQILKRTNVLAIPKNQVFLKSQRAVAHCFLKRTRSIKESLFIRTCQQNLKCIKAVATLKIKFLVLDTRGWAPVVRPPPYMSCSASATGTVGDHIASGGSEHPPKQDMQWCVPEPPPYMSRSEC